MIMMTMRLKWTYCPFDHIHMFGINYEQTGWVTGMAYGNSKVLAQEILPKVLLEQVKEQNER